MPPEIEKFRDAYVERRQNSLNSPDASQDLIIYDLLTRIGVQVAPVHHDTQAVIEVMRHGPDDAPLRLLANLIYLPKQRPNDAD